MSAIAVRVEKKAAPYDSPATKTVQAANRPLGETRARLGAAGEEAAQRAQVGVDDQGPVVLGERARRGAQAHTGARGGVEALAGEVGDGARGLRGPGRDRGEGAAVRARRAAQEGQPVLRAEGDAARRDGRAARPRSLAARGGTQYQCGGETPEEQHGRGEYEQAA